MAAVRSVLARLSPRGRIALAGAAVAVLVLVFVMFQMATKTSYSTVASGVDPAETGDITKALEEKGIGYQIGDGGTSVAVPSSEMAKARIALAESNVIGGSKPGFELFDKQQFGASDFQQKVTYQRALEGELERTIGQVDGVSGVTVQLTLPEDQLFAAEAVKPTAAVLLSGDSGSVGAGSVRGIAQLVASSVEGLSAKDVTITDGSGRLLWPAGSGGVGGGSGAASKQLVEQRYDRGLEAQLDALLLRTVGPEKGRVQVHADIDANRTTESKLQYAKKGTPISRSSEDETLNGSAAPPAGGAAGAAGNIPSYATAGAGGAGSNYKRKTEEAQYGVDKTVIHTQVAPGSVNRQAISLVLDDSIPPAEATQLKNAVAAAAGLEPKRGDTITMSQIAFAKPPEPPAASPVGGILNIVKYVLLGLAGAAFLFFVGRHLRRRQEEVLDAEPVWLRELNAPTSIADLELAETREQRWQPEDGPSRDSEDVERMEPERVAQQLRAWMKEG